MKYSPITPWVMWFFSAIYFAFQFIMRLCPGLIMPQVLERFQVSAGDYGQLSSIYYLGYAGSQVPVALLLDRYGPRKVIATSALLGSIGSYLFATTDLWPVLMLSRFFIGCASAAGFLGVSKVVSSWFDRKNYGFMLGISLTVGLAGAVYGGKPVASLMNLYGSYEVLQAIAFLGFGLTLLFWFILKDHGPHSIAMEPVRISDLKLLFRYRVLFILGAANLLMVGPFEGFADVWGISFLMTAQKIERDDAALFCSMIFTGMLIGGPIVAAVANRWKAHVEVAAGCGIITFLVFAYVLSATSTIPTPLLVGSMLVIGVMCCYQILILDLGGRAVPAQLMGVAIATLNCINMVGGSFFHWIIGKTLDFVAVTDAESGKRIYEASHYATALWVVPIASLIGAIALIAIRKRFAHQKTDAVAAQPVEA